MKGSETIGKAHPAMFKACNISHVSVSSYHVMYALQSESTLYSCLNVKELLARNRDEI